MEGFSWPCGADGIEVWPGDRVSVPGQYKDARVHSVTFTANANTCVIFVQGNEGVFSVTTSSNQLVHIKEDA